MRQFRLPDQFAAELVENGTNDRILLPFPLHVLVRIEIRSGFFRIGRFEIIADHEPYGFQGRTEERLDPFDDVLFLMGEETVMKFIRHADDRRCVAEIFRPAVLKQRSHVDLVRFYRCEQLAPDLFEDAGIPVRLYGLQRLDVDGRPARRFRGRGRGATFDGRLAEELSRPRRLGRVDRLASGG